MCWRFKVYSKSNLCCSSSKLMHTIFRSDLFLTHRFILKTISLNCLKIYTNSVHLNLNILNANTYSTKTAEEGKKCILVYEKWWSTWGLLNHGCCDVQTPLLHLHCLLTVLCIFMLTTFWFLFVFTVIKNV